MSKFSRGWLSTKVTKIVNSWSLEKKRIKADDFKKPLYSFVSILHHCFNDASHKLVRNALISNKVIAEFSRVKGSSQLSLSNQK